MPCICCLIWLPPLHLNFHIPASTPYSSSLGYRLDFTRRLRSRNIWWDYTSTVLQYALHRWRWCSLALLFNVLRPWALVCLKYPKTPCLKPTPLGYTHQTGTQPTDHECWRNIANYNCFQKFHNTVLNKFFTSKAKSCPSDRSICIYSSAILNKGNNFFVHKRNWLNAWLARATASSPEHLTRPREGNTTQ